MKNREELYQKSVNILLDAYNDGHLEHGNCAACAVGNLVAANLGIKLVSVPNVENFEPKNRWDVCDDQGHSWFNAVLEEDLYKDVAAKQIDSTGYSLKEIIEIESAFESIRDRYIISENEAQYKGLTAVLNKLAEIHDIENKNSGENQVKLTKVYNNLQIV